MFWHNQPYTAARPTPLPLVLGPVVPLVSLISPGLTRQSLQLPLPDCLLLTAPLTTIHFQVLIHTSYVLTPDMPLPLISHRWLATRQCSLLGASFLPTTGRQLVPLILNFPGIIPPGPQKLFIPPRVLNLTHVLQKGQQALTIPNPSPCPLPEILFMMPI